MKEGSLININTKELFELVNEDTKKLIYIGRSTCPGCLEMEPVLSNALKQENIKAYYYDTKRAREEEFNEFDKAKSDLNAHYIPLLLYYDKDKEVERVDYYKFVESEDYVIGLVKRFAENDRISSYC